MSYDDEDNLEALKKNNKKLLSQAVSIIQSLNISIFDYYSIFSIT